MWWWRKIIRIAIRRTEQEALESKSGFARVETFDFGRSHQPHTQMKSSRKQLVTPPPLLTSDSTDSIAVLAHVLRLMAPIATLVPNFEAPATIVDAARGATAAGRGRGLLRRGLNIVRINE